MADTIKSYSLHEVVDDPVFDTNGYTVYNLEDAIGTNEPVITRFSQAPFVNYEDKSIAEVADEHGYHISSSTDNRLCIKDSILLINTDPYMVQEFSKIFVPSNLTWYRLSDTILEAMREKSNKSSDKVKFLNFAFLLSNNQYLKVQYYHDKVNLGVNAYPPVITSYDGSYGYPDGCYFNNHWWSLEGSSIVSVGVTDTGEGVGSPRYDRIYRAEVKTQTTPAFIGPWKNNKNPQAGDNFFGTTAEMNHLDVTGLKFAFAYSEYEHAFVIFTQLESSATIHSAGEYHIAADYFKLVGKNVVISDKPGPEPPEPPIPGGTGKFPGLPPSVVPLRNVFGDLDYAHNIRLWDMSNCPNAMFMQNVVGDLDYKYVEFGDNNVIRVKTDIGFTHFGAMGLNNQHRYPMVYRITSRKEISKSVFECTYVLDGSTLFQYYGIDKNINVNRTDDKNQWRKFINDGKLLFTGENTQEVFDYHSIIRSHWAIHLINGRTVLLSDLADFLTWFLDSSYQDRIYGMIDGLYLVPYGIVEDEIPTESGNPFSPIEGNTIRFLGNASYTPSDGGQLYEMSNGTVRVNLYDYSYFIEDAYDLYDAKYELFIPYYGMIKPAPNVLKMISSGTCALFYNFSVNDMQVSCSFVDGQGYGGELSSWVKLPYMGLPYDKGVSATKWVGIDMLTNIATGAIGGAVVGGGPIGAAIGGVGAFGASVLNLEKINETSSTGGVSCSGFPSVYKRSIYMIITKPEISHKNYYEAIGYPVNDSFLYVPPKQGAFYWLDLLHVRNKLFGFYGGVDDTVRDAAIRDFDDKPMLYNYEEWYPGND